MQLEILPVRVRSAGRTCDHQQGYTHGMTQIQRLDHSKAQKWEKKELKHYSCEVFEKSSKLTREMRLGTLVLNYLSPGLLIGAEWWCCIPCSLPVKIAFLFLTCFSIRFVSTVADMPNTRRNSRAFPTFSITAVIVPFTRRDSMILVSKTLGSIEKVTVVERRGKEERPHGLKATWEKLWHICLNAIIFSKVFTDSKFNTKYLGLFRRTNDYIHYILVSYSSKSLKS